MGNQMNSGQNGQGAGSFSLEDISFIQAIFFVIASLFFVAGSGLAFYVAWENLKNKSTAPDNLHE